MKGVKSHQRGNPRIAELGKNTRFEHGRSGNPGGRPSKTPYADAYRKVATLTLAELSLQKSDPVALAVAKRVAREAVRGRIGAASECANRAEGSARCQAEVVDDETSGTTHPYDGVKLVQTLRKIYELDEPTTEIQELRDLNRSPVENCTRTIIGVK